MATESVVRKPDESSMEAPSCLWCNWPFSNLECTKL